MFNFMFRSFEAFRIKKENKKPHHAGLGHMGAALINRNVILTCT